MEIAALVFFLVAYLGSVLGFGLEFAVLIFFLVYLGMILGFWPGLALDRTGIALLGAIAFIEIEGISIPKAASYVDLSALAILFSFMIISAQFYFSGFYTFVIKRIGQMTLSPSMLLLMVIFVSAVLSAALINDIVCLALTPLIIKICLEKNLKPVPFLIGLACASNIGSAVTLIGNPQNILIGQVFNIPFVQYLKISLVPCLLGLVATWSVITLQVRGKWREKTEEITTKSITFDKWQSVKGVVVIILILIIFLFTDLERDKVSLTAAGLLLLSRRMASQTMLSFIDWQLLVLFAGLFVVNRSFLHIMHDAGDISKFIELHHINFHSPAWLISISVILSNIVSNVPAVMLLLPFIHTHLEGSILALSSTLAGNLFIVGSIANLIVITQASPYGIHIDWKKHVKIGLPVTIITILLAAGWLYLIGEGS